MEKHLCATSRTIPCGLLVFISLCFFPPSSPADDWTVGVGGNPARNSLSQEQGPAVPVIAWQGSLNAVVAQQAVIEGSIVAMPRMEDINDVLHGTRIVAHDIETGDTLWTTELPVDFPSTDWRSRVSAIRDGQVYATRAGNTNASYMYALDALTGDSLWRSEGLVTESTTESSTFASDGDVITTGINSVIRINREDGATVWETARTCPTTGGCDPVVYKSRVYLWEAGAFGPVITSFDAETGNRLFSSEGIGGGFVQQVAPFVGPDGTVYAPRTQNNPLTDYLVAFKDSGSGFTESWRVPLGFVPFASFGVGPDGSVFSYSRSNRVLRIDPSGGEILDSSEVLVSDFYQPRMAVDSLGVVFVTNGGFSQGALYAFTPELGPLWSDPIINVNVGGPALGQHGFLIVCGVGTDVRAYRYTPLSVDEHDPGLPGSQAILEQNFPNPFNPTTAIRYEMRDVGYVRLRIYDLLGREIATLVNEQMGPGTYNVQFDGTAFASGTYLCRLEVGGFVETKRLVLLK